MDKEQQKARDAEIRRKRIKKGELMVLVSNRLRNKGTADTVFVRLVECLMDLMSLQRSPKGSHQGPGKKRQDAAEASVDELVKQLEQENKG